jgi:hypothetical protein
LARNVVHFEFADKSRVGIYKFRVDGDPKVYVWFEYGNGTGSLFTTPRPGPFRAEDPLDPAPFSDLDALLAARGTTKAQWVEDLLAQYGERLAWRYP